MTAHWMAYLLTISALLSVAAAACSALVRRAGGDGSRWPWLGAMLGGLALPAMVRLFPNPPQEGGDAGSGVLLSDPLHVVLGPAADTLRFAPMLDDVLATVWIALSLGTGLRLLLLYRASRRALRYARPGHEAGEEVLLADFGPAVVGALRPVVVLPRWATELATADRRLLVSHERSHIDAGDPATLLVAQVAAVLTPWNPLTWWQLRNLRNAVELDCDRRVTRRHGVADYGRVLLEASHRRLGHPSPALSFARSPSQLQRRIRTMTRPHSRSPRALFAVATGLAGLALLGACGVDQPLNTPEPLPPVAATANAELEPASEWDQRPNLTNRAAFGEALNAAYPSALRADGINGQVWLRVHITEQGEVDRAELLESSGYPAMDEGARRTMLDVAVFEPAMLRGQPVATWISLPLNFVSR